jgi:dihydroneopterin aldolase
MSVIAIRNLEFQGRHGATAAERKTLRRFQVDLELRTDLDAAIRTDRLADTIDYHAVCALIVDLGTSRTFHLIESLAAAIVDAVAEKFPGVDLEVEVRKLNPPCPGNPAYTAVRMSRSAAPGMRLAQR